MKEINKEKSIAIGLIIYNPSPNLTQRVTMLVALGFEVYIFDNSPQVDVVRRQLASDDNVKYSTFGKNVGLGVGITGVCAQAYYDEYLALMFFDQDTDFNADTLEFIEKFYASKSENLSKYSMVNFNAKNTSKDSANIMDYSFNDVNLAINSGSLYILESVKDIGWHDLSYFVDGVDYKFCLESAKKNYKIAECSHTPGFDHVSEQDDIVYRFFHKKYLVRRYNIIRVKDAIHSNLRLIKSSVLSCEFRLGAKFFRFLVIYISTQCYVRLIDIINK